MKNVVTNLNTISKKTYKLNLKMGLDTSAVDKAIIKVGSQTAAKLSVVQPGLKASGGFVDTGEIYIARESGPEMVGTIGNRSAVANNDQIVAAVSQGVASAVASVMGGSQNISVNVDGQNLFNIVANRNNSIVRQTGSSPLLV